MTIAIALQVHDGLVLASDSATTLSNLAVPGSVLNVYNNANKIFNLRKGLPIGAVTYGMGSIGHASISTLAKDLRARFSGEDQNFLDWKIGQDGAFTIEEVAIKARQFLYEEKLLPLGMKLGNGVHFGFIIAGYSTGAPLSEVWQITFEDDRCDPPKLLLAQGVTDIYAAGDPEFFSRFVLGYGQKLAPTLVQLGLDPQQIQPALATIQAAMHENLIESAMPIQDAIDLAEFLVHATTMFTRFKRGAPTVGGPMESAVITKHEHFKWVHRKHYFDTTLNPSGDAQ